MLSMRNLSRVYRTDTVETTALDGIFLDVEDGEFVAIMGPSGCGKSTLLNVIGMLDSPTEGSYVFNGTEVAGLSEVLAERPCFAALVDPAAGGRRFPMSAAILTLREGAYSHEVLRNRGAVVRPEPSK